MPATKLWYRGIGPNFEKGVGHLSLLGQFVATTKCGVSPKLYAMCCTLPEGWMKQLVEKPWRIRTAFLHVCAGYRGLLRSRIGRAASVPGWKNVHPVMWTSKTTFLVKNTTFVDVSWVSLVVGSQRMETSSPIPEKRLEDAREHLPITWNIMLKVILPWSKKTVTGNRLFDLLYFSNGQSEG